MNLLITLCARGGSKGIPGKNIRTLNGLPLIGYSINTAKKLSDLVDAKVDIVLSTDSTEIKHVAYNLGLKSEYLRPDELAGDTSGKLDAITHVKEYHELLYGKKYDYILDLDISSPLRTVEDLTQGYNILSKDSKAVNLFSVNIANRNPYFNMVEKADNGYYKLSKKLGGNILSRQMAPKVYELNASFYWYKKSFFERGYQTVISDTALIYEMPHICFDLDHEIDFDFMEYLLVNNKLLFSL